MKIDTFKCDICGAMKQESNHWWTLFTFGYKASGFSWYATAPHNSVNDFKPNSQMDLCSEGCLVKAEAQFREVILKNARQGKVKITSGSKEDWAGGQKLLIFMAYNQPTVFHIIENVNQILKNKLDEFDLDFVTNHVCPKCNYLILFHAERQNAYSLTIFAGCNCMKYISYTIADTTVYNLKSTYHLATYLNEILGMLSKDMILKNSNE